ncbi:hypothetical protein ACGF0J_35890 [Nonomuraea sp. NPDC047897]|uniref:hypothetical protein n=1 Tax=Nonomuraea sp. NPDC047897 TaxID=3364346 RepID=UPI0037115A81
MDKRHRLREAVDNRSHRGVGGVGEGARWNGTLAVMGDDEVIGRHDPAGGTETGW